MKCSILRLMKKYIEFITPDLFKEPDGIHGIHHTQRVLILVSKLAKRLHQEEYWKILAASAIYHDIGRTHNGVDHDHGYKSFEKLKTIGFPNFLHEKEIQYVQFLMETHPLEDSVIPQLIKFYKIDYDVAITLFRIFKDADGLDRIRLGDLNKKYLRTAVSGKLIPFAKSLFEAYQKNLLIC